MDAEFMHVVFKVALAAMVLVVLVHAVNKRWFQAGLAALTIIVVSAFEANLDRLAEWVNGIVSMQVGGTSLGVIVLVVAGGFILATFIQSS